jgi:hypothetical protein
VAKVQKNRHPKGGDELLWVATGSGIPACSSLPGAVAGAARAIGAAGATEVTAGHPLLEFAVLVGGQDRLKVVVAGGHQGFDLFAFLLGQEVVVVVDGLGLTAEVILAGFQFCDLVIGEIECLTEPFKAAVGHELGPVIPEPAGGGLLIFLKWSQESFNFCLLFLLQGDEAGLVLLQRDIILFEQVLAFLPIFLIDGHNLFPLFGRVVDEFAMSAAESVLSVVVLSESVLAGAMEGIAVPAVEGTGGAVETVEARIVGGAVETMMHYMGRVGGLGVRCKTKG